MIRNDIVAGFISKGSHSVVGVAKREVCKTTCLVLGDLDFQKDWKVTGSTAFSHFKRMNMIAAGSPGPPLG